ncbi:unnamed protein product [Bemisia tabaci]|uniref:Uncharacterized protein n=1 Tax=Bemisia tabaci TaxID=7038 RepID=A0A9P0A933_BEMTA|nr:unnamed protein product [Bemisia tabaci]
MRIMAPGTSSMLRARRRDVNVKPNRVLDRSSSRGMIYENEELRLRTININAEVERSQSDIKKLRRENEQLKREIWQLREEYDKLEDKLKEKEQLEEQEDESEDEDEEEENGEEENGEEENGNTEESAEKENADQENAQNQRKAGSIRKIFDNLSTVEEVSEESSENGPFSSPPKQEISYPPGSTIPPQYLAAPNHLRPPPPPQRIDPSVFPNQTTNPFLQPVAPLCPCCRLHGGPSDPRDPVQNGPVRVEGPTLRTGPDVGVYSDGSQTDCLDNCTSLDHRLHPLQPSYSHFPLPCDAINGVIQEVKYSTLPTRIQTPNTQVQGEIVTTILTRRQSFQAKVDPQTGTGVTEVRHDAANSFQCTPFSESESTQFLRLNSVQPFTLTFQTQQFPEITVQEVIDELLGQFSPELQSSLKGVRMVNGSCFVSLGRQADLDRVLTSGVSIKGKTVELSDASIGTSVICLSGVPHHIPDQTVDKVLSKYGCLVGQVERRLYKGVDIGERFARLRARLAVPRFLSISGHTVKIRVLHDDEVNNLSISRRRSFRSQLNIRLTLPTSDNTPDSSANVNDSQPSLSDRTVPQIHLTPPIPPLPGEAAEKPVISPPFGHYNPFCDVTQNFAPSTESLENKTNSSRNTHHSLPDFVAVSSSDPHFFYPASSGVVSAPGTLTGKAKEPDLKAGQANCFQFPTVAGTSETGNQSPPSSVDKKTCSSDKDLDSEKEKKGEKGKKKGKKGKLAKQSKLAERKSGPQVSTECSQSSSSGQDSPSKNRRQLSVNFKRDGVPGGVGVPLRGHSPIFRAASFERPRVGLERDTAADMGGNLSEFERSNSETSSRFGSSNAPRKMSSTGREKAKVPWCGCWGNGCC